MATSPVRVGSLEHRNQYRLRDGLRLQRFQCLADGALLLQEFKRESTRVGGARGESALVDAFKFPFVEDRAG